MNTSQWYGYDNNLGQVVFRTDPTACLLRVVDIHFGWVAAQQGAAVCLLALTRFWLEGS